MKYAIVCIQCIINGKPHQCYTVEIDNLDSVEQARMRLRDWKYKEHFIIVPYYPVVERQRMPDELEQYRIEPPQYPQPTVDAIVASTNV